MCESKQCNSAKITRELLEQNGYNIVREVCVRLFEDDFYYNTTDDNDVYVKLCAMNTLDIYVMSYQNNEIIHVTYGCNNYHIEWEN